MSSIFSEEERRPIGQRIQIIQKAARLSNGQMADMLEISEGQYTKYIRGVCEIPEDKFIMLHQKLQVSMDYLFSGEEAPGHLFGKVGKVKSEEQYQIFSRLNTSYILNLPREERIDKVIEELGRTIEIINSLRD